MPGPAPKHPSERRRRNARPEMTRLPAEGRKGDPPDFPLTRSNKAEREVWAELWATPQATAWERLGWVRTVARYARLLVQAEKKDTTAAIASEVRQLEDRLGLSPMSMRRLQWEIVSDDLDEQRKEKSGSSRERMKAVDPEAADG